MRAENIEDIPEQLDYKFLNEIYKIDKEDVITSYKKHNFENLIEFKEFVEFKIDFTAFIKDLFKNLLRDNIIIYSKVYYRLTGTNTKGYQGQIKASKHIFDNYIKNSYQFKRIEKYCLGMKADDLIRSYGQLIPCELLALYNYLF